MLLGWSSDPIREMELSQIDPRPTFGICEVCKEPIKGSCTGYYGDDYFEMGVDEYVCEDCISQYVNRFRKEAP